MSRKLISHSADLKKLRDEGYDLQIRSGYLLVKDVPYVNSRKEIKLGILVSTLTLAGDITSRPEDHVAHFVGDYPCNADGKEIEQIRNSCENRTLAEGVVVQHRFSAKPKPSGLYEDYYVKVTTYVAIISGPAQLIDPLITSKTFPVIEPDKENEETVFNYIDTASSRAEIDFVAKKLEPLKIAIVGLGGTGCYVLDLVAKTPVKEIHLFDGDAFLQHNAFRSPGAPSIDDLMTKPPKVVYLKSLYSKMHRGVIDHAVYVDAGNVGELQNMDFGFLCLDRSSAKKMIVEMLEYCGVPFIDVGMGVNVTDDSLGGILRITTSTPKQRDHVRNRISFSDGGRDNQYDTNIQIADLNALNAALAVIKWKKLFGFYRDLKREHHSTYTIDCDLLTNEDMR
ncbi:ThiF family adenylyltransferase [bacterium]|nr:ThiF family adenylyltransferase [bacterium]